MTGLKLEDVDLRSRTLVVLGKGRRERQVRFDHKAAQAVDRYLRVRARHRLASEPWLWLGLAGRLTDNGLAGKAVQGLRRRRGGDLWVQATN